MSGMNASTGRALSGIEHICQSIGKILTTPLGTRVERRDFGSELPDLIDAPNNAATRVRLYAATATALMRLEPRVKLTRVLLADASAEASAAILDIEGVSTETGAAISARVPLTQGASA